MTNKQAQPPATFTRQEIVDKPGIIGARWWQESIAVPRRQAMTGLLALGGVVAAMATIGTCAVVAARDSEPEVTFQPRGALDMQKEYGWSFGATGESLVFDGQSTQAFDRAALARMSDDLAPAEASHAPYFVPTLFQSPKALPKSTLPSTSQDGETGSAPFAPLENALVPIATPAMETAFEQGRALASLLDKDPRAQDVTVVVDLPGPEAVAFAAGASSVLDPVFLFDNWPHPRGVVPAHLTLAAATYYQPLFVKTKTARQSAGKRARPMFVLDRKRLASYTDDASQFDNRHTARLPGAANLVALGTKTLLYVGPNPVDRQELDDLADDFAAYTQAQMALKLLPATAFDRERVSADAPTPSGGTTDWNGPYFYGGSRAAHPTFWTHWSAPNGPWTNQLTAYQPTPRVTPYSSGTATSSAPRPRPAGFGTVPVAVAVGTGVILGARLSRSGSWNRTTGTSSGS